MYEIFMALAALGLTGYGVYMIASPKAATKAVNREIPEKVKKTKSLGYFVVIGGIVLIGLTIARFFLLS